MFTRQGVYVKHPEESEMFQARTLGKALWRNSSLITLPNPISFGTTTMGSKAASAAENGRNKDLELGNNRPRSGSSE